jgi:SAM-dependent methyltransferase
VPRGRPGEDVVAVNPPADRTIWAEAEPFERYVGRWSRLVARELVAWLALPPGARWLDVGCGTGALAAAIVDAADPAGVDGLDLSPGLVAYARGQIRDPRARFEVGDALSLPVPPRLYDAAVAGLLLNFLPAPERAVAGMAATVRPGGTVGSYVWDYAGRMEMMRHFWAGAVALDPAITERDDTRRFSRWNADRLAALFQESGLARVTTRPIEVPTEFRDFDDYWLPFLGGQGSAPGYLASLAPSRREAVRDAVRARLPVRPDGSILLVARAWAVRGVRS